MEGGKVKGKPKPLRRALLGTGHWAPSLPGARSQQPATPRPPL